MDLREVTFGGLHEAQFQGAMKHCEGVKDKCEKAFTQQGNHQPIDPVELCKDALKYVEEYEKYWALALEAQTFALSLLNEIEGLRLQSRIYLDLDLLEKFKPKLKKTIEATDTAVQEYIKKLQQTYFDVNTFQEQMKKQLKEATSFAVQRYSQIVVGNKGAFKEETSTGTLPVEAVNS